jgi:hypothetical protein
MDVIAEWKAERERERHRGAAAWAEFWTNKPNPPGHADYMARAAAAYPDLPPGAQQNALYCLETHGKSAARRYVTNARARKADAERLAAYFAAPRIGNLTVPA